MDREIFAPTAKVYVHGENGEVEEETEVHSHLHVFKGHLENQQNAIARASLKGKVRCLASLPTLTVAVGLPMCYPAWK